MLALQVFFKGQMEYAIISFSVGDKILPWLFQANKSSTIYITLYFIFSLTEHEIKSAGSNGFLPGFLVCTEYDTFTPCIASASANSKYPAYPAASNCWLRTGTCRGRYLSAY